jgi:DNA-binding NtrC family response regulator
MGTVQHILFVDDEPYLAEVGQEMLEDYGYLVEALTDPFQALERFQQNPEKYHLLITDFSMPGMTGRVLVEKIHAIQPGLPVILCSGVELAPEAVDALTLFEVLIKPFDMEKLLSTVDRILPSEI